MLGTTKRDRTENMGASSTGRDGRPACCSPPSLPHPHFLFVSKGMRDRSNDLRQATNEYPTPAPPPCRADDRIKAGWVRGQPFLLLELGVQINRLPPFPRPAAGCYSRGVAADVGPGAGPCATHLFEQGERGFPHPWGGGQWGVGGSAGGGVFVVVVFVVMVVVAGVVLGW